MLTIASIFRRQRLGQAPFQVLLRNYHKKPVKVIWKKPEIGWTKLNFDGSCKCETGEGSIGGVIRNHNAEFLLGYAEPMDKKTNSTIAEFAALTRGLELMLENGWTDLLWLEGDSKNLVEIIAQKRSAKCPQIQKHVSHINSMILEFKNCVLTHKYREGNRVADKFAKMGYKEKRPQIWRPDPPNEVLRIVNEDARGKIFLRSIK